jgi:cellulose synthase (UDP-forming)
MTPARLVPLFDSRGKLGYLLGLTAWAAAMGYFWSWWLRPEHNTWAIGYAMVTLVLIWVTFLPLYFMVIFFGAKRIRGDLALPEGSRIAMVVTKAPSEPVEILKKTLLAMLAQDLPHDNWLADEDPSPEMVAFCREHGVRISTRKGVEAYHQKAWPRRTRCKEGNLAYFYDHYGYERYDFVAQLDADHVPEPDYLREIMKPFGDPEVGYVSAPSICDANARESWSAAGRLHVEASMHGALQVGYNYGWAPLCIGSHYAVRTAALREIGGLGPELAEDHSTTLLFNAGGWKGVHAVDAIAHGDGPSTFADLATQEFQWSRSLTTILLQYMPTYYHRLPAPLKFQFVFSQLWYPLFAGFMALMYLMPMIALLLRRPFVGVTFPDFLLHYMPVGLTMIALAYSWRRTGVFRPIDAPILSWQGAAFLFARWPWALAGCLASVRDRITGTFVDFRVTPKGAGPAAHLPRRVLMPYAIMSVGAILPTFLVSDAGSAGGFYIFSILNAVTYGGLLLLIVLRHARENGLSIGFSGPRLAYAAQISAVVALLALPVAAGSLRGEAGLTALTQGLWSATEPGDPILSPEPEASREMMISRGPADVPRISGNVQSNSADVVKSSGNEG